MAKTKEDDRRQQTIESAKKVLDLNYQNGYTAPSKTLYPHQWLWDSSFHAIGLRHHKPERALEELQLLLRGQWQNGMVPHMLFSDAKHGHNRYNIWKSHVCNDCIAGLRTSAITQPPVIAWAFEQVIASLPKKAQKPTIEKYLPQLIRYHQWLYKERDPEHTGRVVIIHPWESGLDNNPALIHAMRQCFPINKTEEMFIKSGLFHLVYDRFFRKDLRYISADERTTGVENWMAGRLITRYRRQLYNIEAILLDADSFVIEDVAFNSILMRSNSSLRALAKKAGQDLPAELDESIERSEAALADFWDDDAGMYLSRDWHSHQKIDIQTITGLLPLITTKIPKARATRLTKKLESPDFATDWPVPTNATTNRDYDPIRYWQGPTWINMNWMLIQGLENHGHKKQSKELRQKTLQMVERSGVWEYYNSQTCSGHGINNFSWTAALYLDLING